MARRKPSSQNAQVYLLSHRHANHCCFSQGDARAPRPQPGFTAPLRSRTEGLAVPGRQGHLRVGSRLQRGGTHTHTPAPLSDLDRRGNTVRPAHGATLGHVAGSLGTLTGTPTARTLT